MEIIACPLHAKARLKRLCASGNSRFRTARVARSPAEAAPERERNRGLHARFGAITNSSRRSRRRKETSVKLDWATAAIRACGAVSGSTNRKDCRRPWSLIAAENSLSQGWLRWSNRHASRSLSAMLEAGVKHPITKSSSKIGRLRNLAAAAQVTSGQSAGQPW